MSIPLTEDGRRLTKALLADCGDFRVYDVRCAADHSPWSAPEETTDHAIVFVRRGCFRRRADGAESVLDAASVYVERPGQEQQIAHPHDDGDACTQIVLSERLADELHTRELPCWTRPTLSDAATDLLHRAFVSASRRGDDFDSTAALAALVAAIAVHGAPHPTGTRPATAAARRGTVDRAREALSADPNISVRNLASLVAASPHHLSRIFRAETGETISHYRNRIRVRIVLERLGEGERSLARLAAELGFADQAHLCRAVRTEAGDTPSALRLALRGSRVS